MIGKAERKKDYREKDSLCQLFDICKPGNSPAAGFSRRRPGLASLGRQSYPNRGGQAGRASKRL